MREIESTKARNIPRAIALADGAAAHYADADSNIAIARTGDTFLVYDYTTGNVTREMTRAEVNAELARYRERKSASAVQERATSEKAADVNAKDGKGRRVALLTNEDLEEYMSTGKTLHTRNKKQRMLDNGKKPILTSENEIREFISDAIHGKAGGEVRAFARVPKRLAKAISAIRSSLELEGNYLEFQADALREAYKVHSSPKMQGDIALTESDFENLHRHIFDFDGVLSVNDYNGKTEVHIFRRTKTGYYQIITVSSSERKSLQVTKLIGVSKEKFETKYAKKIERNTGSPRMSKASTPSTKARHTAGALSNLIIPDSAGKVNTSDEKSAKSLSEMLPMEEKAAPTIKQIKEAAEARRQDAEIEALAKEKIKDYEDLSKPNQSMIRKVLREARAKGLSDADALSYARVAARSGLDIVFDKKACYNKEKGTYAAGFYDPENNRIVVNPETKRKHASLLIHELSHAIRAYLGNDGKRHYKAGIDDVTKISDEMWEKINADYGDGTISEMQTELRIDEASAYYAEQMLGTDAAIELLLGETPTLRQQILSFFKQSARDYSADEKLSREARRLLRDYKTLFDRFSARNRGRNTEAGNVSKKSDKRYSLNEFSDGKRFVLLQTDQSLFDGLNIKEQTDLATQIIKKRFQGHVIGLENKAFVNGVTANEYSHPSKHIENDLYSAKMRASTELDNLMDAGFNFRTSADGLDGHTHSSAVGGFSYFDVIFKVGNEYFKGVINIENNRKGKRLKDITKIENITKDMTSQYGKNHKYAFLRDASMIIIPDSTEKSNPSDENSSEKSTNSGKRFSMEEIDPAKMGEPKLPRTAGTMSTGQHKKRIADLTKAKSYTKDQIYDIVKKLPMADMAMEKTREQVAEAIWQIYNEQLTANERREAAHDIAQFLVARLSKGETVTSLECA